MALVMTPKLPSPGNPDEESNSSNIKQLKKDKTEIDKLKGEIEKSVSEINKTVDNAFGKEARLTCISKKLREASFLIRLAGLKDHAKYELEQAGLLKKDSVYNGLLGSAVLELCDCFSKQGHSGQSAELTLDLFETLAKFHTLTPITSNVQEWADVSKETGSPLWQNKRDPMFFSKDKGKTWYVV